ncbi:PREDICTED: putative pentatricopeptide repeat-containing protein At3g05240 [Nelumbo nucifera]|uniref:Pentatricopeptide repeat-containing protein At3g05240 n=2 Tax=Nelumbo nucifera TaxID=4432 RepID=A0A1U7ZX78_NELNU|nr:PREDICTED: putative pentatricopeptide repeat-containing protein At3g05240 [Nelumbo nucifera]DAD31241.1 TPA_asm: hypothetical protein HUJ06_010092 [Nelumbo nucifera]
MWEKLSHLLRRKTDRFSYRDLLQIHAQLITTGFHVYRSWLLAFLELCASNPSALDHATALLRHIKHPDVSLWRVMIRRYASDVNPHHSLSFFRDMLRIKGDAHLDPFICASVIKACGKVAAIREGKSVHCQVLRIGLDSNVNILNTLIHFYSNTANSISRCYTLFDRMPQRTIVTVNCMISGCMKNELFEVGLRLFNQVQGGSFELGMKPNDVTLVILLSACAEFGDLGIGKSLHSYCCKANLCLEISTCNALINLYSKFGFMEEATRLFGEMPQRDLISWNTIIKGYAENNDCRKALALFREMRGGDLEGDGITLISLLSGCAQSRDLDMGKWVHAYLKIRGLAITIPVGTALINMYSKCGLIDFARRVFDELSHKNIVSWNSMIHGYVECGLFKEAFGLFDLMRCQGLKPDEITMLALVLACRNSGQLNHGIQIHSYIENSGLNGKPLLDNALIDMYAKCGSMNRAKRVFDKMKMLQRDVFSWTSIIVGHAINGQGEEALNAFQQMRAANINPNAVTFIGVLLACDHAGLVEDGFHLYQSMLKVHKIEPSIEHYGCMIDMLARAGLLEGAHEFVKNMPIEPNAVVWRMLISACRIHGEVDLGLSLVDGLLETKKLRGTEEYVISSNVLAEAGRWDDVLRARRLMLAQQVMKKPGRSSISAVTE